MEKNDKMLIGQKILRDNIALDIRVLRKVITESISDALQEPTTNTRLVEMARCREYFKYFLDTYMINWGEHYKDQMLRYFNRETKRLCLLVTQYETDGFYIGKG